MTRQNVRKALLAIALLLFQIKLLHLFFSPVLGVAAASQGIVPASLLVYGLLLLSSLFLGRAFCGWFCPGAALQELTSLVVRKRAKGGWRYRIKYAVCGAWLAAVVFAVTRAGGFHKIDLLFGTEHGSAAQAYLVRFGAYVLIVPLALLFGRWATCHYVCWIAPFLVAGTRIQALWRCPSLRLRADPSVCTDCESCNDHCPMSLDVNQMVRSAVMRNDECMLCGNCVDHCPTGSVNFTFSNGLK